MRERRGTDAISSPHSVGLESEHAIAQRNWSNSVWGQNLNTSRRPTRRFAELDGDARIEAMRAGVREFFENIGGTSFMRDVENLLDHGAGLREPVSDSAGTRNADHDWSSDKGLLGALQRTDPDAASLLLQLPKLDCASAEVLRLHKTCPICAEDFVLDSEAVLTPCSHAFHLNCLAGCLRVSKNCPSCRWDITCDGKDLALRRSAGTSADDDSNDDMLPEIEIVSQSELYNLLTQVGSDSEELGDDDGDTYDDDVDGEEGEEEEDHPNGDEDNSSSSSSSSSSSASGGSRSRSRSSRRENTSPAQGMPTRRQTPSIVQRSLWRGLIDLVLDDAGGRLKWLRVQSRVVDYYLRQTGETLTITRERRAELNMSALASLPESYTSSDSRWVTQEPGMSIKLRKFRKSPAWRTLTDLVLHAAGGRRMTVDDLSQKVIGLYKEWNLNEVSREGLAYDNSDRLLVDQVGGCTELPDETLSYCMLANIPASYLSQHDHFVRLPS